MITPKEGRGAWDRKNVGACMVPRMGWGEWYHVWEWGGNRKSQGKWWNCIKIEGLENDIAENGKRIERIENSVEGIEN